MPSFDVETLRMIVVQMIILVLSITVHEFGHAWVADRLGDALPRHQGRVTLNPVAHADPLGTLAFPLLGLLFTGGASIGFGWGRPVQVNPTSFDRRLRMRTGHMLVAAAGPAMNILFGLLISLLLYLLLRTGVLSFQHLDLIWGLRTAILVNFVLAFFNLIPAPPLDGGAVLRGLLPTRALPAFDRFAQYGFLVLLAVIFFAPLKLLFVWPARQLYSLWAMGLLGLP